MPRDRQINSGLATQEAEITEFADPSCLARSPLVSVTMSTYNHAPWIAQAIEGVIAQQCSFPFELIVGDDGSNDGTTDICRDYQQRYPHLIRLVTVDRNTGSKQNLRRQRDRIRGEFQALCEGDDYWCDPEKLERQVAMLQKHPECSLAFARTQILFVDRDDGVQLPAGVIGPRRSKLLFSPAELFQDHYIAHTSSMVFRTLDSYPDQYWKPKAHGDIWISLLCMERGPAVFVDRVMSIYRDTGKGMISGRSGMEKIEAVRNNMRDVLEYSRERQIPFIQVIEKQMLMVEIRFLRRLRAAQGKEAVKEHCRQLLRNSRIWSFPSQWWPLGKEFIRTFGL